MLRRKARHPLGIELAVLLCLHVARRGFWGATFRLPLEREEKETMPSLPGDRQRPDPVELFGAASVFLPISGTPDDEPSRRRRRRLPDVRKKPIARMVANTTWKNQG